MQQSAQIWRITFQVLFRCGIIAGIASFVIHSSAAAEPVEAAPASKEVLAFFDNHCLRCHSAKEAKAGFRVDQLPADFNAPKAADHWKEVLDKINLGEMPPAEEKQPTATEFEPVVLWINTQLRNQELAAKNAGGRIPMRRLNRVEFTNSVRDLLQIDPSLLAALVEELPGDGKAEGFDRLGVALFFDQTQIERTLGVAERIAALAIVDEEPKVLTQRAEAEANPRVKPAAKTKHPFTKTTIESGPAGFEIVKGGVKFVHGYGNRPKGENLGRIGTLNCDTVVTQDGYYKIRIQAGADQGSRGEPIFVKANYGSQTPVAKAFEIPIDAPLAAPKIFETVVFLRAGPDGLKRGIEFQFNDIPDLIVSTPENNHFSRAIREGIEKVRAAKAEKTPAEVTAAENELNKIQAEASQWKGPLRHYRPDRDSKTPPTLFVDWYEISGPVVAEWPPRSHRTLFFDGDQRQDAGYVSDIFTRFLPRAYRRPVSAAEIDGVVQLVEQARRTGTSMPNAIRLGLRAC